MKKGLLTLLLISGVAQAKNLGTWGEMYPIAEQDMLTTIQTRLKAMEASGEMAGSRKHSNSASLKILCVPGRLKD